MTNQPSLLDQAAESELADSVPDTALAVPEGGVPAVDFQRLFEAALDSPERVQALKELQEIYIKERDYRSRMSFQSAKAQVRKALKQIPILKSGKRIDDKDGFGYYYATRGDLETALEKAGAVDLGFSWHYTTEIVGDRTFSVCILGHVDGHEERSAFPIEVESRSNRKLSETQKQHQATSGSDRVALARAWGLDITTDPLSREAEQRDPVTADEALTLESRCREVAETLGQDPKQKAAKMLEWAGVDAFEDFPKSKYQQALNTLARSLEKK